MKALNSKNHPPLGKLSNKNKMRSTNNQAISGKKNKLLDPIIPSDSDEHDNFNPIQDLMPATIAGNSDIELIGKKRGREHDPLRRLIEEDSSEEFNAAAGLSKRQKLSN